MKRVVLLYGLLSGMILSLMVFTMMFVNESDGFEQGNSLGYIFNVAAYTMIFLGIRRYRENYLSGTITFSHGFRVGILITLIGSLFYVISWQMYIHMIDPAFTSKYAEYFTEKIRTSGKTEDEITRELELFNRNIAQYKNPGLMAMYTFLEIFPGGLLVTVLCALMMKREQKREPQP